MLKSYIYRNANERFAVGFKENGFADKGIADLLGTSPDDNIQA